MRYENPVVVIKEEQHDILSFEEFKERRGLLNLTNQSIDYQIEKDKLDYVVLGRFRHIVWNEKAKAFNMSYKTAVKTA